MDALFSVQYLAAVNIGTLFLNEERVAKSKKELGMWNGETAMVPM